MKRLHLLIISIVLSAFTLLGCAALPALVHIVDAILADSQEASSKLETVESMVQLWFAEHPDPAKQKIVATAIADCRLTLDSATALAKGTKEMSQADYDAAFADFNVAWSKLVMVLADIGIMGVGTDGLLTAAPGGPAFTITPPRAVKQ